MRIFKFSNGLHVCVSHILVISPVQMGDYSYHCTIQFMFQDKPTYVQWSYCKENTTGKGWADQSFISQYQCEVNQLIELWENTHDINIVKVP